MEDLNTLQYIIGFFGAFIAGFIDAIIGGGGLITLPLLLSFGIPAGIAISTNKLQAVMSSITALFTLRKKCPFKELSLGIIFAIIASICGSFSVQMFSNAFLKPIILILLIFVFLFTILKPSFGNLPNQKRFSSSFVLIVFGILLGFYDGFMGPGTGSFWIFTLILLLGLDMRSASIHAKALNTASNVASLLFFLFFYKILYKIGLIMGAGGILGAILGARYLLVINIKIIRALFCFIVSLIIIKILLDLLIF